MKKSIESVVFEHQCVLNTRERLEKMFSMIADCHITIGGSYMLKYWCDAFADREVTDYDLILYALPENIEKIRKFIYLLKRQSDTAVADYRDNQVISMFDYDGGGYFTFYFGKCNGLPVNIILKPVDRYCPCSIYELLDEIINIKREWCSKAMKYGRKPRYKDVWDIAVYEEWLYGKGLPF